MAEKRSTVWRNAHLRILEGNRELASARLSVTNALLEVEAMKFILYLPKLKQLKPQD